MLDFEQNTVVYPPNKILERQIELSKTPVIYDTLLFIDFNDRGESILSSSSLNSTKWEGTTLFFNEESSLLSLNYNSYYIGSTVSDGRFLTSDRIILAEDTGILNILSVDRQQNVLQSVNYFRHNERVKKLAIWKNSSDVVTCSGRTVFIWNVEKERIPIYKFENYHTASVNYVDTIKNGSNSFVSVSTDKKCCLWDLRNKQPASVLYCNEFSALTSVACNPLNSNYIVVGTEGGDIYLLDQREPKDFISVANCNKIYVHRLIFDKLNRLAICGDTNKIFVFNCEDEILHNFHWNDKHTGIVRGLTWYNEILYSCGFDTRVIKHCF